MVKIPKYKKDILRRHALKSLKRRLWSKKKKKLKLRSLMHQDKVSIELSYDLKHKFFDYIKICAPKNFSLINNEIETVDFINKIKQNYDKRRKVFIRLRYVENVTTDAIVVLLSTMIRFATHGISFNGDYPKKTSICSKIVGSGFFKHLYNKYKKEDKYTVNDMNNSIYTHAEKNVSPELADNLIEYASETIWGEKRRCPGVQRTFIELMQNTNNHASEVAGEKHWWVSVSRNKNDKTVTFSFIDYGKGIFNSLENKKPGDIFYNWKQKLLNCYPSATKRNDELKLILQGELHKTSTKSYFRGKGLPGIYDTFKANKLSSLVIITNNVYANVSKDDFHLMKSEFLGTFVSWELNENTINLPWL